MTHELRMRTADAIYTDICRLFCTYAIPQENPLPGRVITANAAWVRALHGAAETLSDCAQPRSVDLGLVVTFALLKIHEKAQELLGARKYWLGDAIPRHCKMCIKMSETAGTMKLRRVDGWLAIFRTAIPGPIPNMTVMFLQLLLGAGWALDPRQPRTPDKLYFIFVMPQRRCLSPRRR
jgi:hypothetical protein